MLITPDVTPLLHDAFIIDAFAVLAMPGLMRHTLC